MNRLPGITTILISHTGQKATRKNTQSQRFSHQHLAGTTLTLYNRVQGLRCNSLQLLRYARAHR